MVKNVQNWIPSGPCKGHQVVLMSSCSFLAVILGHKLTEFGVQKFRNVTEVSDLSIITDSSVSWHIAQMVLSIYQCNTFAGAKRQKVTCSKATSASQTLPEIIICNDKLAQLPTIMYGTFTGNLNALSKKRKMSKTGNYKMVSGGHLDNDGSWSA